MKLTDFEGVGEAVAARILKEFGTEEAFFAAARAMEVDRIAAVDGISTRKAVEIVLKVLGRSPVDFLRTPRAETLYEDVLARIAAFASTDYARNRIHLLVPLTDRRAIESHLDWALGQRDAVSKLPRDEIVPLLRRLGKPRVPRPKFDSGMAILVDGDAEQQALVKAGLDRHCQILVPEDGVGGEFDVVVYAYTAGSLDVTGAENVVSVPFSKEKGDLVPESVLLYYRENRPLLETAASLAARLGRRSAIPEVLEALDRLERREVDFSGVEALVHRTAEEMNAELKARMQSLSLGGDEALEMMSGRTPRRIRDLQTGILRAGRDRLMKATGEDFPVFTDGFPVAVDEDSLAKRRQEFVGRKRRAIFREKVTEARRLNALRGAVEAEIQSLLEFDYGFAVGSFALAYGLTRPRFGKAFRLRGALHLNLLATGEGARIDYALGGEDNVVLLTGANSGGKTTLLETLGQVAILAHLGLPVNAEEATVDHVEAIHFFTQKRSLDAGAFEGFLKGFVPIVTSPTRKLVLADELEAMTELEAASRIVGTFVDLLRASRSYGVCVTHMAEEVSRHASVRIDGIEASGLDEAYNLIVDRTPKMGYRARSTPELILRRLRNKAAPAEREVYDLILSKFG